MGKCISCFDGLNSLNHAEYRKKNYINKCNNCVKIEKREQARLIPKEKIRERSKNYLAALKIKDPIRYSCCQLSSSAQKRAKKFNMDFDINSAFLIGISPIKCPVFNVDLIYGAGIKGKYAASIDRIDSSKGYTKDNVQIISYLANLMKSNATHSEMVKFAEWIKNGTHKDSLK